MYVATWNQQVRWSNEIHFHKTYSGRLVENTRKNIQDKKI